MRASRSGQRCAVSSGNVACGVSPFVAPCAAAATRGAPHQGLPELAAGCVADVPCGAAWGEGGGEAS